MTLEVLNDYKFMVPDTNRMPLMYVILSGLILVLGVMVAIVFLLVHHNKKLENMKLQVKQRQVQQRRSTQRKPQGKVIDDGYISPSEVVVDRPAILPQHHLPKHLYHNSPAIYIEPINGPYENISISSGHSYESLEKFRN